MNNFNLIFFTVISLLIFGSFKGVSGTIWPCENDNDCKLFIKDAFCSQTANCQCPVGYVFSLNFTKCLKALLYGEKCEESVQCSHMPSGARCLKGVCQCNEGYTYVRGRCRQLQPLGKYCKEDVDCYFGYDRESVKCKQNICVCADDYYNRTNNICRRKSMGVNNGPCVVDSDCNSFINENGFRCDKLKCVQNTETRRPSKDISVQTSFDNFQLQPVPEINEENHEKGEEIELKTLSSSNTETESKVGDKCEENGKECKGLPHSLCVENVCYCRLGYFPKNAKCMAELGEEAASKSLCPTKYYNAETKKCGCQVNYFYADNLRECKKPISSFDASCTFHGQCSPFGYSFCDFNLPNKRCVCNMYAQFDERTQLCTYKEGLGGPCEVCKIPHSTCSKEKKCVCKEHFLENNGQCVAGISGECNKHKDCAVENSECVIKPINNNISSESTEIQVCKCKKKFVQIEEKCLKEVTDAGEECLDSDQCKPLLGELGKCIENKCTCEDHHHLSYGKCEQKKALGESCSKLSECFTPEDPKTLECRNSVCRCQIGYTADIEKQICIKPKSKSNSSGRPSCLKVITFLLIGSAILITSAALKQAYY